MSTYVDIEKIMLADRIVNATRIWNAQTAQRDRILHPTRGPFLPVCGAEVTRKMYECGWKLTHHYGDGVTRFEKGRFFIFVSANGTHSRVLTMGACKEEIRLHENGVRFQKGNAS